MTVLSVVMDEREGLWDRHPLDLRHCARALQTDSNGKSARFRVVAVRHNKAAGGVTTGQNKIDGLHDAMAFIFCGREKAISTFKVSMAAANANVDAVEESQHGCSEPSQGACIGGVQLPPFQLGSLGLLLPAAMAAHQGLLLPSGAMCACLPIMSPFSVPPVSTDAWLSNKRAVAFHRCIVLGVFAQGTFALFKFGSGDLVGGVYLALQAAMGAYAMTPDGLSLMTSYMMVCGFNGLLSGVQALQQAQGVPLKMLLSSAAGLMTVVPPVVSILACYWGWQFIKELQAIGQGMACEGDQETCWVKFMGGDIWPLTTLSPLSASSEGQPLRGQSMPGRAPTGFSAFGGNGQRLGES